MTAGFVRMPCLAVRAIPLLLLFLWANNPALASGISVDAGLTPAENRWILRMQVREMPFSSSGEALSEMRMRGTMVMVAYGVHQRLTVMGMQSWMRMEMSNEMHSKTLSGRADPSLLAKYSVYRMNRRDLTLGVASTLKFTLPFGDTDFSSDFYSIIPGIYFSARSIPWAMDLSFSYVVNDVFQETQSGASGWEYNIDAAISRQIPIASHLSMAIAPLLEINLGRSGFSEQDDVNTLLMVSPGVKWTISSFIVEALIQHPVIQEQNEASLQAETRGLIGVRLMF